MTTNPDTAAQRHEFLAQLASLTTMERGTLTEEYREHPAPEGRGTIRLGPYFKHQCWEKGRNRSARVPAPCVGMLREDLENAQRFDELTRRLEELAVENGRARRAALGAKSESAAGLDAKKNSTSTRSGKNTAKRKPSSPRSTRGLPKKKA
jgi:hypothetical protein